MLPPVFSLIKNDPSVLSFFGPAPIRVFPFGVSDSGEVVPYAVWSVVDGLSPAYLSDTADVDLFVLLFCVYGDETEELAAAATALRDVLETVGEVSSYNVGGDATGRDKVAKRYWISFEFTCLVQRQ